jgi:hypothetical protein
MTAAVSAPGCIGPTYIRKCWPIRCRVNPNSKFTELAQIVGQRQASNMDFQPNANSRNLGQPCEFLISTMRRPYQRRALTPLGLRDRLQRRWPLPPRRAPLGLLIQGARGPGGRAPPQPGSSIEFLPTSHFARDPLDVTYRPPPPWLSGCYNPRVQPPLWMRTNMATTRRRRRGPAQGPRDRGFRGVT